MVESLTDLAWEQLAKYVQMSAHARKCAATAESREEREYFIEVARQWEGLAAKLKAEAGPAQSGHPAMQGNSATQAAAQH
jgi:hypothetical protein